MVKIFHIMTITMAIGPGSVLINYPIRDDTDLYYPKFPQLYSRRINSLIINNCTKIPDWTLSILDFNKGIFPHIFPPFWSIIFI